MRQTLLVLPALFLLAGPPPAAADAEGEHVFETGKIRIVHPWARAAEAGGNTLVFMEIENGGEADLLAGAESAVAASARIVGMMLKDGTQAAQEIGPIEIPTGDFVLDPGGVAIELVGLKTAIAAGDEIDLELRLKAAGDMHLHADVEAADATQHSHAGHAH